MKKYTLREIKNLAELGVAEDITTTLPENWRDLRLSPIGVSTGNAGMNGGLFRSDCTGDLYVITARSSNLFLLM